MKIKSILIGFIIGSVANIALAAVPVPVPDITRQQHLDEIKSTLQTHWTNETAKEADYLFQPAPTANSFATHKEKLKQAEPKAAFSADVLQKSFTDQYIYQTGDVSLGVKDAFDRHLNAQYCSKNSRLMACDSEVNPYADILPGKLLNKTTLETAEEQQAALDLMLNLVGDSNQTINNLIQEGKNISDNVKNQEMVGTVFKEAAVVALARKPLIDSITSRMPQKDSNGNDIPSVKASQAELLKSLNSEQYSLDMASAHPAAVLRQIGIALPLLINKLDNIENHLEYLAITNGTLLGQIVEMKQRMNAPR